MHRKTLGKEKREKKKGKASQTLEMRTVSHPIYGEIPLIQENNTWRCDPDFQPKMPPKAIRGNVRKQEFCYWCHFPKYFYVDEEHQCVDCGVKFSFSANEQKYWYEERKFNFYSKPIRCVSCRRKKRNERKLKIQMTEATNAIKDTPNDAIVLLNYAEVAYEYFEEFGQGNLDQAIASARKAFELSPKLFEALYWEGVCQDAAGHFKKAKQTYQHFLEVTRRISRYVPLLKQAEKRLEELEEFSVEEASLNAYGKSA